MVARICRFDKSASRNFVIVRAMGNEHEKNVKTKKVKQMPRVKTLASMN
jgi:hypothetical protein